MQLDLNSEGDEFVNITMFQCGYCRLMFMDFNSMENHEKTHELENKLIHDR